MKLGEGEKLILLMLSEIYEKLGIKGETDPGFVREAICSGNSWGLKWKYPFIFETEENSDAVVAQVVNILDMWSFLEEGYDGRSVAEKARIEKETGRKDIRFLGFDGNNETEQLGVARFLIDHLDRYSRFKGRDLNSHMELVDAYNRMFEEFEPLRADLGMRSEIRLTVDEMIGILKVRDH